MKQQQDLSISAGNLANLNPDDILFIVPLIVGSRIFTERNVYRTLYPVNMLMAFWKTPHLVRCHRDFTINPNKIDWFTDRKIQMGERTIPIDPTYRRNLMKWFKKYCITVEGTE